MESKVSLRRAFGDTLRSPRVAPLLLVMVCITLAGEAVDSRSAYVMFASAAPAFFIYGYMLSVARWAAHDDPDVLPPLSDFATHLRRAGTMYVLMTLPLFGLTAIVGVVALALTPIAELVGPPALWNALAVAGFVLVTFVLIMWLVIGDVAVSGRYVWFDRLREGLRYRDAVTRFWRLRNEAFTPVALMVVTALANLLLRWGVGTAIDTRMLRGFGAAVLALASGPSLKSTIHVAVVLVLHVVNVPVQLAYAHAVGQYSRLAFGGEQATAARPAQPAFPDNPRPRELRSYRGRVSGLGLQVKRTTFDTWGTNAAPWVPLPPRRSGSRASPCRCSD